MMMFLKNKSRLNILSHLLNVSAFVGIYLLLAACNESGGETIAQPSNVDGWSEERETGTISSSAIQNASSSSIVLPPIIYGSMTDHRDGLTYKTVTIGSQIWMAENLKYEGSISYCYDGVIENCQVYGNLYPWNSAIGACPSGWRLPSREDFNVLFATIDSALGKTHYFYESFLKSTYGWGECSQNPNGLDLFGFSALPAGKRLANGTFADMFCGAIFWTATEIEPGYFDEEYAYNYNIIIYDGGDGFGFGLKENAFSVRCLMEDEMERSSSSEGLFVDSRDGQTYKTVRIGDQVWMAENLNYKMTDSYCFDNSENNCSEYGRLYKWRDALNACPSDWHLPNQAEFQELLDVSDGIENLKASAWGGTDLYGFSALPAGKYDAIAGGTFTTSQMQTGWWLQSESEVSSHAPLYAYYSGSGLFRSDDVVNGFSVRCIYDGMSVENVKSSSSEILKSSSSQRMESSSSSDITNPAEGTLVDSRDGQVYKTVTIGTQTWMAENLNYKTTGSYCFDEQERYCAKYGRLYRLATSACPDGWHLPSRTEWETLCNAVGGVSSAGKALKSTSGCWSSGAHIGTDAFGFSALPAGKKTDRWGYSNECDGAFFWTSTPWENNWYYVANVSNMYDYVSFSYLEIDDGASVRCLKGSE